MEIGACLLKPVGISVMGSSFKPFFSGSFGGEQDVATGMHPLAGEHIGLVHKRYGKTATIRLIGNRRIIEPVEQDNRPSRKRRNDSLFSDVSLAPIRAKSKVYILDRVDLLGTQAANAFLKTLEEPVPGVVFVLLGRTREGVLPTIVSRCHVVPFRHIPAREVA